MNTRISSQILLALAAAAAAPAATVTGVGVATGPTTLTTAIVVDNTGSASTTKGFKVTRDSATKNISLDGGEFLMDFNIPPSGGVEYLRSVTFDPMILKMEWKQRVSGADTVQTSALRSQTGLYMDHTYPAGTTTTSKSLTIATQVGTLYKVQGGSTNKFTQSQADISYDNTTGPTSIIEVNGQHGSVANNNFATLPVLNTPATFLWTGTYSDPGLTTASGSSDFPMMTFGGAGNKLKLYKDPVTRSGIAGAATPTIVMDPLYGNIDIAGGVTVNGTPLLSRTNLRIGGTGVNGSIAVGSGAVAGGANASAFGVGSSAAGAGSIATGEGSAAGGNYSISGGQYSWAGGDYSMAMGVDTSADGLGATAFGHASIASGNYSLAAGEVAYATGHYSFATGNTTEALGAASFAQGSTTKARSSFSAALGRGTETWFVDQTTVGRYSLTPGAYTSAPSGTAAATDTVFVVGGGTGPSVRSNALEVQANGNLKAAGTVTAAGLTSTGTVTAVGVTATGTVTAAGATFTAPVILTGAAVTGDIPMYVP